MVESNKTKFLLCNLDSEKYAQVDLDLVFTEGEEVTFFLNGDGVVHLTGYQLAFDDDDDFDEDDEEEEASAGNSKRSLSSESSNASKKTKIVNNAVNGLGDEDEEDDEEDDDDENVFGALDEEFDSDEDEEEYEDEEDEDDIGLCICVMKQINLFYFLIFRIEAKACSKANQCKQAASES